MWERPRGVAAETPSLNGVRRHTSGESRGIPDAGRFTAPGSTASGCNPNADARHPSVESPVPLLRDPAAVTASTRCLSRGGTAATPVPFAVRIPRLPAKINLMNPVSPRNFSGSGHFFDTSRRRQRDGRSSPEFPPRHSFVPSGPEAFSSPPSATSGSAVRTGAKGADASRVCFAPPSCS